MLRILFLLYAFFLTAFEKVHYPFTNDPIDVVILCAPKDLLTLELCIDGIRKNGENLRRIIVLSKERMTENAEWFPEARFPFTKWEIALEIYEGDEGAAQEFISSSKTRIGWIYQQLLKFYIHSVIPDLSPNVLILDSDVIFLKKNRFMTEEGEPIFISGREYFPAYFQHAARLLPGLKRVNMGKSGVVHHMLFQRPVIEDLFRLIEKKHHVEPWKALCRCIDHREIYKSCLSEYEIYFNFIQLRCNQWHIHSAKWKEIQNLALLSIYKRLDEVFVACPEWLRNLYE